MCRRQWIQDTQAHVRQVTDSLENVDQGFPATAIPGNAELHTEVNIANEQQQMAVAQQDDALDRIEKAAQRVGQLGLEIHRELGVCSFLFFCASERLLASRRCRCALFCPNAFSAASSGRAPRESARVSAARAHVPICRCSALTLSVSVPVFAPELFSRARTCVKLNECEHVP